MTVEDSYRGRRIMVTGGAGFIGSHLVDSLLDVGADQVTVVDTFFLGNELNLCEANRRADGRLRVVREDASEADAMRALVSEHQPDVVFNLATKALLYSFFNPAGAARVNFEIACNLAELQRAGSFGRLVHFSSSEVYGSAQRVPMPEDHPLLAETSYAAGKAAADLLLLSYVNMFGADITVVRPFNNYGPRQNEGALAAIIPLTLRRIREGQRPVIEGDGLQTRDLIFVEDTVSAALEVAALDGISGRVLNIGSGLEVSVLEIVRSLCAAVDYDGDIEFRPARPADVRRHCADTSEVEQVLGRTVATTNLEVGLAKTIAWYGRATA